MGADEESWLTGQTRKLVVHSTWCGVVPEAAGETIAEVTGNEKQQEMEVRTKKNVSAMARMIWDKVEIESGHWCMILVNESQNHWEVTEKARCGRTQRCKSS